MGFAKGPPAGLPGPTQSLITKTPLVVPTAMKPENLVKKSIRGMTAYSAAEPSGFRMDTNANLIGANPVVTSLRKSSLANPRRSGQHDSCQCADGSMCRRPSAPTSGCSSR